MRRALGTVAAGAAAIGGLLLAPASAGAATTLKQLSTDPFTNSYSQHQTEVEPDITSFGSTLVGAFQVGRVAGGGAADIGWATSRDSGATWSHGFLPGLTVNQGAGPNRAASDPAVAYDAAHGRWLIVSLPLTQAGAAGVDVSASPDGLTWGNPVVVTPPAGLDKTWIACDNTQASPHYGHCYVEWDNASGGDIVEMSTSVDGGASWSVPRHPAGANGLGGQPLVQPSGKVIVPFLADRGDVEAYSSTDGGASWTSPVAVASARAHLDPGGFRGGPLPSARADGSGRVYVTWESCLFETGCATNDAVLSTSADGSSWTAPVRIPVAASGTKLDVMIPGLGVDAATAGTSAHLGIVYYTFSNVNCTAATCQLNVGFISSANGGGKWSAPQQLAGPMKLNWLANSQNGRMVGDYFSTAFAGGKAFPIFAVAKAPHRPAAFDEAMYTVSGGVPVR